MTVSRFLFSFCIFFILGIGLASLVNFSQLLLLAFLISGIFLVSVFWPTKSSMAIAAHKRLVILGFCIIFLTLGIERYQFAKTRLKRPELEKFFAQEVVFEGRVLDEPEEKDYKSKLKVEINTLKATVLITTQLYPRIEYGSKIKVWGILKKPPEFEGFNYKEYLQAQGVYFLMDYPNIEILENSCGNIFKKTLISFEQTLKKSLERIVPVPDAGFFEALIFGDEENIPWVWKQKLNITGTRHIAAVSGANITIICDILLNMFLGLGFWRKQALWASLALISLYILMIGAPACAVRAGIMGALLLLAQNFGRIAQPERLMIFTLTFMLLFNPLLLKHDIGFQLSFLAFAGLIYLSPLFLKILKRYRITKFGQIRLNLASTLSAQVFVLPLLLYNFGQLSLVSPITNILILPNISFLTIGGFLFAFLGIFWKGLAQVLSWPVQIVMIIIIKIIDVFSGISWAARQIHISWIFVLVSYILLVIFIYWLKRKQRLWFLDY